MTTRLRPLSFRARLTLRWTLAVGGVLALANTAIYTATKWSMLSDFDAQVRTLAATELASSTDQGQGIHLHEFPRATVGARDYADKFSQVLDERGHVLLQSASLGAAVALVPPEAIAAALRREAPVVKRTIDGRRARVSALGFAYEGRQYVIAVGQYADEIYAHLTRLAWLLGSVWVVALLATGAVGLVLASRALAPVERITARAASIARGDIDARLDPPLVDDEIGRMARLLNEMLERLHAVIDANRRFASDASHELRSPLTAMAGEVDVALKRERTPEEYRDTLRTLRGQLQEMKELTDNLMLLVRAQERPEPGMVREVPLEDLVRASIDRLGPAARANDVSVHHVRLDRFIVYADARMLSRAVDNVIGNAVQYNRRGGRTDVTAEYAEPQASGWAPGMVTLRVHDTGPGIPAAEWERVFDRFYRLDHSRSRRTGGSGLGLSITRAVVALFGGTVRIAASSAEGTTMEIVLPGARIDALPAPDGERARPLPVDA